jgi:hypothetical protein
MAGDAIEKHLLAGLDERERGFSRPVEIERREGAFGAIFRYETFALESAGAGSAAAALAEVVRVLQERGYRQLKTRLIVLGGAYLGSQELWVEYADPERLPESAGGWAGLVLQIRQALTRRS